MGPSTARKVSIELDCGVVTSDAGASSEDILLLDELADISGSKVAIVRGIGGRELLAESLRQRGAEVARRGPRTGLRRARRGSGRRCSGPRRRGPSSTPPPCGCRRGWAR